jgi:hypothetical protein
MEALLNSHSQYDTGFYARNTNRSLGTSLYSPYAAGLAGVTTKGEDRYRKDWV